VLMNELLTEIINEPWALPRRAFQFSEHPQMSIQYTELEWVDK
jgi:hypothetical protein